MGRRKILVKPFSFCSAMNIFYTHTATITEKEENEKNMLFARSFSR